MRTWRSSPAVRPTPPTAWSARSRSAWPATRRYRSSSCRRRSRAHRRPIRSGLPQGKEFPGQPPPRHAGYLARKHRQAAQINQHCILAARRTKKSINARTADTCAPVADQPQSLSVIRAFRQGVPVTTGRCRASNPPARHRRSARETGSGPPDLSLLGSGLVHTEDHPASPQSGLPASTPAGGRQREDGFPF